MVLADHRPEPILLKLYLNAITLHVNEKNLVPTITGIQLIKTINNELLKSVELTGIWEKKLRQIEKGEYDPHLFLNEMKEMVSDLTKEVKYEQGQYDYH
jgi:DNA topoisomerase-3